MTMTGEINDRFGVFKSVCCGAEIVIPAGVAFPYCRKHSSLPTIWKSIVEEIRHAPESPEAKNESGARAA
jgi:hypothetical protein